MSERKVIQIAATATSGYAEYLVALCSDGTLWVLDGLNAPQYASWKRIPQPTEDSDADA